MLGEWCVPGIAILFAALPAMAGAIDVGSSRDLMDAARRATPGTRIVLASGTYEGNCRISDLHGSPDAPVEIVPKDYAWAGRPVFRGGDVAFQLINCSYVVVEAIDATAAKVNNIQVGDGSHHVVLRNIKSYAIAGDGNCDGIKIPGLTDFLLDDCNISNWGGEGSAIDMVGCARGLIYKCRFAYPNVKGQTANAIQPKGGTHSMGFYKCQFNDASFRALQFGGSTGKQYFFQGNFAAGYEGLDMAAVGNIIHGGQAAVAFVSCTRCTAEYNTIINPTDFVVRILHEGAGRPPAGNTFSHNLIVYTDLKQVLNIGGPADLTSFVFEANYWFNHKDPASSVPQLRVRQIAPSGGQSPDLGKTLLLPPSSPAYHCGAHAPEVEKAWSKYTSRFAWAWQQVLKSERVPSAETRPAEDR